MLEWDLILFETHLNAVKFTSNLMKYNGTIYAYPKNIKTFEVHNLDKLDSYPLG